jgi:hypothetical protein
MQNHNLHNEANSQLRIWQQNLNRSKIAQLEMLETADPNEWDILLLQEPYLDKVELTRASTHWNVIYPPTKTADNHNTIRSVILLNANIPLGSATCESIPIPSSDITALRLLTQNGWISLINIYNDCRHNDTITLLSNYIDDNAALLRPSEDDHMLWLGDFNRHHAWWEGTNNQQLRSTDEQINPLLQMISDSEMEMILPVGIPTLESLATRTWTRPDNVWCTDTSTHLINTCDTRPAIRPAKTDHLPIITILDINTPRTTNTPRRVFRGVDWPQFQELLKEKLARETQLKEHQEIWVIGLDTG